MKFADNIIRDKSDMTFIKKSEKEFESRDEYNSNLWDIEQRNISFDKNSKIRVHLYSVPIRAVKIGENIYDQQGEFETYRSS